MQPREFALLEYLMLKPRQVVSRREIEEHIYNDLDAPESNAVDSAICALRRKIASYPGAPPLIHTRRGLGYVVTDADTMKSLYQRLSVWLLASLGIVWLAVGFSVYMTVRRSLEGRFDAELQAMASEVRYLLPEGRNLQMAKPSAYWFDFYQPDSGLYFEVWDEYLLFSDRSTSLGDRQLPRPPAFGEEPRIWNATLATGEKVRIIAQRLMQFMPARPGAADESAEGGYPLNVVVARNRNALDRSLRLLLAATGLAGVLLIPVSFLTMRLAVGRGLRPLRDFAERTAAFGIDSLSERFQTDGVPAELLPISQRLNELMDRLAAGIERERRLNEDLAHELRTPVAELKTMAEVALGLARPDRGENYREVLGAANQMQSLIDSMLLLARWERNTERPAMEQVESGGNGGEMLPAAGGGRDRQGAARSQNDYPGMRSCIRIPSCFASSCPISSPMPLNTAPMGGELIIETPADSGRFHPHGGELRRGSGWAGCSASVRAILAAGFGPKRNRACGAGVAARQVLRRDFVPTPCRQTE